MDVGLSVALMSEKEKFKFQVPTPSGNTVHIQSSNIDYICIRGGGGGGGGVQAYDFGKFDFEI